MPVRNLAQIIVTERRKSVKKDKKFYYSMIVISFLTLYLVSMVFSTYMVKENYTKEYRDYLTNLKHGMVEAFEQDRASVLR